MHDHANDTYIFFRIFIWGIALVMTIGYLAEWGSKGHDPAGDYYYRRYSGWKAVFWLAILVALTNWPME